MPVKTVIVEQVSVIKDSQLEVHTAIVIKGWDLGGYGNFNGFNLAGNHFNAINVGDALDLTYEDFGGLPKISQVFVNRIEIPTRKIQRLENQT